MKIEIWWTIILWFIHNLVMLIIEVLEILTTEVIVEFK